MELVKPDKKYKDSFIEAIETGFNALRVGSQAPMDVEEIADIKNDFDAYFAKKVLKPYDPTPKLRPDGQYYPNVPETPYCPGMSTFSVAPLFTVRPVSVPLPSASVSSPPSRTE